MTLDVHKRVGWLRRLCRRVVPWLCSSSCHVVLLAGLVGVYQWRGAPDAPGGAARPTISDTVVTWQIDSQVGSLDDAVRSTSLDTAEPERHPTGSITRAFVGDPQTIEDDSSSARLLDESREIQVASFFDARAAQDNRDAAPREDVDDEVHGKSSAGSLPTGYTRTGVFGASGVGRKFVYVFDRSASMDGHGGAPLAAAKRELLASLQDLDQTHQFQIIFYNERPRVFNPTGVLGRLVFGTDQNKNLAEKFVGSITADGATQHEEALAMALKLAPDVVFFLTDADEPRMNSDQLARIARLNKGTAINTIEFGFGPEVKRDNFLIKLAQQNAGQHVYVDVSKLAKPRGK